MMPFRSLGPTLALVLTLVALAVAHLQENAAELEVTRADVADLVVTSAYESPHNGVTHVNLNQHHEDLEVFGGHATVNVGPDGRVVFTGGSLVGGLGARASGAADLEATEAV